MRQRLSRTYRVLATYDQLILFSILLVVTLFFIRESFELAEDPRLVPLLTLSVALILILTKLIILVLRHLGIELQDRVQGQFGSLPVIGGLLSFDSESISIHQQSEDESFDPRLFVKALVWAWVFALTIYLIGILAAVPLLMFIFIALESNISWWKNAAITAGVVIFIYLVFIEFLNIIIYDGVFSVGY